MGDSPPRDPRIGSVLHGRYRVLEVLAEGGMGIVYRGERVGLARPVAIKFLHAAHAHLAGARRRFEIEATAAGRMTHPNCAGVIDVGLDGDAPYLVMELVAGRTLREVMLDAPVAPARAVALGRQVLAGLAHAHARGVVHRDVKPENVVVAADPLGEHATLVDFGLAKVAGASGSPALSLDMAIGTPSYMSPEQTLGLPVDARSDVYAMGVLLFELLADRKPFAAATSFETMRLHREAPVPELAEVAPERGVPVELEAVVRGALAKDPAARYASAVELALAFDDALVAARESLDDIPVADLLAAASRGAPWRALLALLALGIAVAMWANA
jgi:serine/threonine-protein kinase|nr:serine/threonine-protein kinase [Kofleriaceae bacterium]